MSPTTTVTIAAFTGKMARMITQSLLQHHPNIKINGICRSLDKVDSSIRSHPNVKVFQATSTDVSTIRSALAGASVCICAYLGDNTLMVDGQKTLIDACIAEGVPRYIASDWTFDYRQLKLGDHPTKDPMIQVRAYLAEKEAKNQIKGVHVLNGVLMEVFWASFLGYVDTEKDTFQYFGTGEEKLDLTTYKDTATFTAEVAADPSAYGFLNVVGDRKSVKELAELYEKRYGVKAETKRIGSLDDLRANMHAAFKQDPENAFAWMGMFYQYYMQNGSTSLGSLDTKRYPVVKPTNVEEFLKGYTKENVGNSAMF